MGLISRLLELIVCWIFAGLIFRWRSRRKRQNKSIKWPTIFTVLMVLAGFSALFNNDSSSASTPKNIPSANKQAKNKQKKPTLHLNGAAKYSNLHLTANAQRQAKISGTVKHAKFITLSQLHGNGSGKTIKITNNKFLTTITLPDNKTKATYIITTNDGDNNDAVAEAIVKSANYDSEQTSIDQAAASSRAESSSNRTSSNATKYQAKLNSLNKGTAESAAYDSSTNTVTWIGFADWKTWSHSDLQKIMDMLQAMTERQESNYGIQSVHIVVQLPDGTVIAKNSEADVDLQFVK